MGVKINLGGFKGAETPLDDQQAFIAGGRVFQGDGVIVGDQDPFAVCAGCFPGGPAVDGKTVGSRLDLEIPSITARGQQINGPAGGGFGVRMFGQLRLQLPEHLLPVQLLSFGFQGIVAGDVAAPSPTITSLACRFSAMTLKRPGRASTSSLTSAWLPSRVANRYLPPALVIVLFVNGKSRRGGVIEDQINFEVEKVGRPEEDRLFHGSAVGLEHVHGFIHLVQLEILNGNASYPGNGAAQAYQAVPVHLIGPAEIMDDLSQGLPGPGVVDIMGQLEVLHLGPILITAFG